MCDCLLQNGKAFQLLEQKGCIARHRRKGTFVCEKKLKRNLNNLYNFTTEMHAIGLTPSSAVISFESVLPPWRSRPYPGKPKRLPLRHYQRTYWPPSRRSRGNLRSHKLKQAGSPAPHLPARQRCPQNHPHLPEHLRRNIRILHHHRPGRHEQIPNHPKQQRHAILPRNLGNLLHFRSKTKGLS